MKVETYVKLRKHDSGVVKAVMTYSGRPKLEPNEIAVRLVLDLPDDAFDRCPTVSVDLSAAAPSSSSPVRADAEWDF